MKVHKNIRLFQDSHPDMAELLDLQGDIEGVADEDAIMWHLGGYVIELESDEEIRSRFASDEKGEGEFEWFGITPESGELFFGWVTNNGGGDTYILNIDLLSVTSTKMIQESIPRDWGKDYIEKLDEIIANLAQSEWE